MTRNGILADAASRIGRQCGCTLSTCIAGSSGSSALLVELLLMAQQQIATRKTPCALGTLEGLLLGMRSLMAFQVLEAGE